MEFAIVDIETTGGYASGSGITEIAIIIHDGEEVIDRFETLLNPGQSIPLYIRELTGIDYHMIAESPRFCDVAETIYKMLAGRVFVAHNVNFDYSFVKHHLSLEGYELNVPRVCTVRLCKKIRPGLRSYSLGRLCEVLDIHIENRHRAGGDADATAILFERLLRWDTEGVLQSMLRKNSKEHTLPPHLPREEFEALPSGAGVYYFRDKAGKVIYVGKALNVKKRVASHFSGHNPNQQRQQFMSDICSVDCEPCGNELMALLLESIEIKKLWPKYNRALKRFEPKFGLYRYEDQNNRLRLAIGKHHPSQLAVHTFYSQSDASDMLHRIVRNFGLCPEVCKIGPCEGNCHQADGAEPCCLARTAPEEHNKLIESALEQLDSQLPSFAIIDRGRHNEEHSCVWIEKGDFYGMGYFSKNSDLQWPDDIKSSLTRYDSSYYLLQLVFDYAAKYPYKVRQLGEEMKPAF